MHNDEKLKEELLKVVDCLNSLGKKNKFNQDPLSFFNVLWNIFGDSHEVSYNIGTLDNSFTLLTIIDNIGITPDGIVYFIDESDLANLDISGSQMAEA